MKFIHVSSACPVGLTILEKRLDAMKRRDEAQLKLADQAEAEHLQNCYQCNPELGSERLQRSLFGGKDVKVIG